MYRQAPLHKMNFGSYHNDLRATGVKQMESLLHQRRALSLGIPGHPRPF